MSLYKSRADFLKSNPRAAAYAALQAATHQQNKITDKAINLKPGQLTGKKVVVIGSGIGGLTTAYELLYQQSGAEVTVLEALNRTGGRCLSLRTGDTLIEDADSELFNSREGEPQVVRFKRPTGDAEPYLNAGPGRIPSSHKRLLSYLKKFSVELEVYVMKSDSNLVQKDESFSGYPVVYRRLDNNTRGWLAQLVYKNAKYLLEKRDLHVDKDVLHERIEALKSLMVSFGELNADGNYEVSAGEEGFENGKTRAGYIKLPGVSAGEISEALSFDSLLESRFWEDTRFYQPADFLWQSTMFQPVGGMDRVQHAFVQQVAALGGIIHLNSPVKKIDWDDSRNKFKISVEKIGVKDLVEYEADYCICNLAMPFLSKILSDALQNPETDTGFEPEFKKALHAVYTAQFEPSKAPGFTYPYGKEHDYIPRFLACTTKVGWQAERALWQGSPIGTQYDDDLKADISDVEDSQIGVVPIFGGISWTDGEIQQIWYPSSDYQDQKGVLTGAYNFSDVAFSWGKLPVKQRLERARNDASKFGEKFASGLEEGLAIAWQNMPYIKGGWAVWQAVGDADYATEQFNVIMQGSAVQKEDAKQTLPCFFIVGDQISSLPGWQEGAIASGLNAICRIARPDVKIASLKSLPDPRLIVEGI